MTEDPLKVRNIPRHDPQAVIITPKHMLNGLNLRDGSHGTFKILKANLPARGQFYAQKNRDPKAVASGNSGTALIDEILVERRKELYGEIGVEWFDAKRLRKGITRTGNHRVKSPGNLLPDDKKFFLKVPQSEIDANDNIDASVNADR